MNGPGTENRMIIGISGLGAARGDMRLITHSLGSCVGICLYDCRTRVGGLAHCLLPRAYPHAPGDRGRMPAGEPGKFVDTALDALLGQMAGLGADVRRLGAKLYGGAAMFSFGGPGTFQNVGMLNAEMAKERLAALDIPILESDVGGTAARTITFDLETGRVDVKVIRRREP